MLPLRLMLAVLLLSGCGQPGSSLDVETCQGQRLVAVTNVQVIPMTGEDQPVLENHTVLVADGFICAVGPAGSLPLPAGTTVVDGEGGFLIPGLFDMHIHLSSENDLALYLAFGVTTVRNMWGVPFDLELREQIQTGQRMGPRLLTTGPLMDGNPPIWRGSEVVETPEEAVASVARQAGQGFDFIKVYERLSLEVYDAIVATADEHGLVVVGHVPRAVGLEHVLRSGQASNEHLTGYQLSGSDGSLEALTVETGMWNCPTLVVYDKYTRIDELHQEDIPELRYLHPAMVADWRRAQSDPWDYNEELAAKVLDLHQLGAPLMAGSDASNPYVIPGVSLHEELALLWQAGLTGYEVLATATVDAARHLGIDGQTGSIQPGLEADLVLLGASPLESIENTRSVQGVMRQGSWIPAPRLQGRLDEIADHYAQMSAN